LLHVLAHFPVHAFWSPAPLDELDHTLQKLLVQRQIPFRLFPPGWTTLIDTPDNSLLAFAPSKGSSLNDLSLVIYARQQRQGVLLTGDLEKTGVDELLHSPPDGPVSLLKLPHHGSRYSQPERLLQFFSPTATFASAGLGNVHGLPHQEVVLAVKEHNLPLYRTDLQGTLRFHTRGQDWVISRWQRGLFH
jgi:competence protein ComEC